ncbi:cytosine permease [Bacillus sp. 522_BSPC]|uniref:cytosine permease n=1 Tax=Bacillus sp. 522_BSPC TaxID=1579338 RepID=UPI0006609991|nr:cytosine permease [Bacillus sp. 522_BSPC]REB73247.1 cytosine permease [Cutibacterium acnes]
MGKVQGDYVSEPVPESARRPWWEITFVTSGFCLAVSGMFAGAALSTGMSLGSVIITILIGNLLLTLFGGFMGAIGAKTGVATSMLAKHAFGKSGSIIISLIFAITLIGWFSVQAGFFGQTIHAMLPNGGFITSSTAASAWGGALMILTAFIGYKAIRVLSNIAIPLLLILSIVGVSLAVSGSGGWGGLTVEVLQPISIMEGIVIVVGTFAVGAVVQPDISRFARSSKDSWIAMTVGMFIANGFIVFAGAVTSLAMGTGDLPAAMLQLGLGIPAILILIAAQWTSNDSNLYSSSLSFANILNMKRSKIVLFVGVVGTIMGAAGIADYFVGFLSTLGVLIPPIAGVMIADYFVVNKEKYKFSQDVRYQQVKWKALVAWILGVAGGVFISWGISSLNGILISFIALVVLNRLGEKTDVQANTLTNKEENI